MGSTESFFPGRVKAAPTADPDACSAEAAETSVPVTEELADVAGVFVDDVALVTAGATIVGLGAVVVGNAVVEGTTVETPCNKPINAQFQRQVYLYAHSRRQLGTRRGLLQSSSQKITQVQRRIQVQKRMQVVGVVPKLTPLRRSWQGRPQKRRSKSQRTTRL